MGIIRNDGGDGIGSNKIMGCVGAWPVIVDVVVVGVVPVIPATMCNKVVEVRVGVYNPGVLAHGSPHIKWSCTRDSATNKCETRFLIWLLSVLCSDGAKPSGYWM